MNTPLVGRAGELAIVAASVRDVEAGGAVLVLAGEPGVGKTALLDAAAVQAHDAGHRVLRIAGRESSSEPTFGALRRLVLPLAGDIDARPAPPRQAISLLRDLAAGPQPEPAAALAALRQSSWRQALLVLVDDLQWLDRSDAVALAFIARRLGGSRVGFFAAARAIAGTVFDEAGLPVLPVRPLDAAAADALVRRHRPQLPVRVRHRVVHEAAGNPRALLELTAAAPDGRGGSLATDCEPRAARRKPAAMAVGRPDRYAQHLDAATLDRRRVIAGVLPSAADRSSSRSQAPGLIAAPRRGVPANQYGPVRPRRFAGSASVGRHAGVDPASSGQLLADPWRGDPAAGVLSAALAASWAALGRDGDAVTAHRLLVAALTARDRPGPDPMEQDALHLLIDVCAVAGRPDLWAALPGILSRAPEPAARTSHLRTTALADPARVSSAQSAQLDTAVARLGAETDPALIVRVAGMALALDRVAGCREPLRRVIHHAGRNGSLAASAAIGLLCASDLRTGRWDEAANLAGQGSAAWARYGFLPGAAALWLDAAWLAAARGEEGAARSSVERVRRWASPRGLRTLVDRGNEILAQLALGLCNAEGAYRHATAVTQPGRLDPYAPTALRVSFDLVDAAVRLGRHDEATRHVRAMQESPAVKLSPRLDLLAAAAAALVAIPDRATGLFEAALATPDADRWPFDQARVQLAFGEHLRRQRRTGPARVLLGVALETFNGLAADPWAAQARHGLRATGFTIGGTSGTAGRPAPSSLTPDEQAVAALAATGLTNKQIAARLMISHHTVAARLYQVFPKLGIGSRAALGRALAQE